MIGAEGGSRTRTTLRSTDFKSQFGYFAEYLAVLPCSFLSGKYTVDYRLCNREYSCLRLSWHTIGAPKMDHQSCSFLCCRVWRGIAHSQARHIQLDSSLTLLDLERQHIERVLREEGGRVEKTARRLGIPRSSLYQKIKKHPY
jgi:transcriptional regulator with GAF, ATPase, and Fis domain